MNCLGYKNWPPRSIPPRPLFLGHDFQQMAMFMLYKKTSATIPSRCFPTPKKSEKNGGSVVFPGFFVQNSRDASKFVGGSWNNKGHWTWKRGFLKGLSSCLRLAVRWWLVFHAFFEDLLLKGSRIANMDWTCSQGMSTCCIIFPAAHVKHFQWNFGSFIQKKYPPSLPLGHHQVSHPNQSMIPVLVAHRWYE